MDNIVIRAQLEDPSAAYVGAVPMGVERSEPERWV